MHTVGEHVGSFLRTESAKSMAHSIADKGIDMVATALESCTKPRQSYKRNEALRKERRDADDNLHVGSSSLTEHQRALLRKMINKH